MIAVPSGKTVDCNSFVGSPNGISPLKINPHEIVGIFFVTPAVAMIAVPSGKTVDCNRFVGSPNGISPLKINPQYFKRTCIFIKPKESNIKQQVASKFRYDKVLCIHSKKSKRSRLLLWIYD
jgi:hypothetical protein